MAFVVIPFPIGRDSVPGQRQPQAVVSCQQHKTAMSPIVLLRHLEAIPPQKYSRREDIRPDFVTCLSTLGVRKEGATT